MTDKAIPFVENGALNCTDGPRFERAASAAIGLDGTYLEANPDGDLVFTNLTGEGNVQACIDPNGKLYRGDPGC